MKKMMNSLTALSLAGLITLTTASVGAASIYRNVTARQNTAMTVKANGVNLTLKDDDTTLYPLEYNGVLYLPAEELADSLGYDTTIKGNTVTITPKKSTSGNITTEKAKEIALKHAGVSASDVFFIKAALDRDDGRQVYDIEFYDGSLEYDYEILASDGTILSFDHDIEHYTFASGSASGSASKEDIGVEQAKKIALKHAGLSSSQVRFQKAERDVEDGQTEYELEFYSNGWEYEYTVDASSGKILHYEKD